MSERVAEGITVKTYAGRAATAEGPFHVIMMYGRAVNPDVQRPLHEATDAIYGITHDSETFHREVMANLRTYIRDLNRIEESPTGGQHDQPLERYEPSRAGWDLFRRTHASASETPEPAIEFLGVDMDPAAFVATVDYVMTNTCFWAEEPGGKGEDPRIAMVDKFRGAN